MKIDRSSFAFMKGNFLILLLTNIVMSFTLSMAHQFVPLYVLALGGTAVTIGFVNSFRYYSSLLLLPIAGHIADSRGRVKMIGVTRILASLYHLLYVFAWGWTALATGNLFRGIFLSFHHPAMSALTADSVPPKRRGVGFAILLAVPGVLSALAPYIGAYVVTKYGANLGIRYLYALAAITSMSIGTIWLKFLKETLKRQSSKTLHITSLLKEAYKSVWDVLKWIPRSLKFLVLIMILNFFFNSIAGPFWIVYATDIIKLNTLEWGTIMLLASLLKTALTIPAGLVIDKFGKKKTIVLSLAMSTFPVALFIYSKTFMHVLLISLLISAVNAFLSPACSSLIADIAPRDMRGRVMAAFGRGTILVSESSAIGGPATGFVVVLPAMFGAIVGGYVYSFNPTYPWILFSTVIAISFILCIIFVKEPEKPEL